MWVVDKGGDEKEIHIGRRVFLIKKVGGLYQVYDHERLLCEYDMRENRYKWYREGGYEIEGVLLKDGFLLNTEIGLLIREILLEIHNIFQSEV